MIGRYEHNDICNVCALAENLIKESNIDMADILPKVLSSLPEDSAELGQYFAGLYYNTQQNGNCSYESLKDTGNLYYLTAQDKGTASNILNELNYNGVKCCSAFDGKKFIIAVPADCKGYAKQIFEKCQSMAITSAMKL